MNSEFLWAAACAFRIINGLIILVVKKLNGSYSITLDRTMRSKKYSLGKVVLNTLKNSNEHFEPLSSYETLRKLSHLYRALTLNEAISLQSSSSSIFFSLMRITYKTNSDRLSETRTIVANYLQKKIFWWFIDPCTFCDVRMRGMLGEIVSRILNLSNERLSCKYYGRDAKGSNPINIDVQYLL